MSTVTARRSRLRFRGLTGRKRGEWAHGVPFGQAVRGTVHDVGRHSAAVSNAAWVCRGPECRDAAERLHAFVFSRPGRLAHRLGITPEDCGLRVPGRAADTCDTATGSGRRDVGQMPTPPDLPAHPPRTLAEHARERQERLDYVDRAFPGSQCRRALRIAVLFNYGDAAAARQELAELLMEVGYLRGLSADDVDRLTMPTGAWLSRQGASQN